LLFLWKDSDLREAFGEFNEVNVLFLMIILRETELFDSSESIGYLPLQQLNIKFDDITIVILQRCVKNDKNKNNKLLYLY
jgi:hypothetical protein